MTLPNLPFMKQRLTDQIADTGGGVAAYESMLDLFTLLSFVLILAAIIYVARVSSGENTASIMAQNARQGNGISSPIPQDSLFLLVFRTNSTDQIAITEGMTGTSHFFAVSNNISSQLSQFSKAFEEARTIKIAAADSFAPAVLVKVMEWLPQHGYHNFNIYLPTTNPTN